MCRNGRFVAPGQEKMSGPAKILGISQISEESLDALNDEGGAGATIKDGLTLRLKRESVQIRFDYEDKSG